MVKLQRAAPIVGTRMEELARHYATLSPIIVNSYIKMLQWIITKLNEPDLSSEDAENYAIAVGYVRYINY